MREFGILKRFKRNPLPIFLVFVNAAAVVCLVYASALYVSHSTNVKNPDAMLPIEDWERGGLMLLLGAVPMTIANALGFFCAFKKGTPLSVRLAMFLPSMAQIALVAHYVFIAGGLQK